MKADYEAACVFNPPALPTPPSFCGDTRAEKSQYMREYEKYRGQPEALQAAGQPPFQMPVSACIEPDEKRRIAYWEMDGRDRNTLTDPPPLEVDDLVEKIKSKMVCDMAISEGDSRVGRMVAASSRFGDEIGQNWIFDVESQVQKKMKHSQNKPLKNNEYHDEAREILELKAAKAAAATPQKTKSTSQSSGAAAVKSIDKYQGTPRFKQKKCIADLYGKYRQKSVKTLVSEDPKRSIAYSAMLDGVMFLSSVLLESGADGLLVTTDVVTALQKLGAAVDIVEVKPMTMKPYGQSSEPLRVTKQARFKTMQFETSFGPLVLRGLKAWVDETSQDCDLLIGKPVMEVLGFSQDGMLVEALRKKAV
ncbi:hypothetical protein H310_12588 [Aphanomyces invadans]|uniref:Uncharacterized protein n=1 Tax=Aphanomyces invadans TaxID=157072 RepID=A0A024THX0_9STRA|nr:hypothetical protein H310_12588 [Aphanomyces invadans]ETV93594.1 hypothetical protein H310_12588 [Aphanomyces invadans]|eukprot:XP_008877936.1 hypothetical protein H310_12588 [Aphanomyces invadans]